MATAVHWIKTQGRTDFEARRGLSDDDVPLVLEHWHEGEQPQFCPVILHADNTFSQYIEGYVESEMACWLLRYTFDQGYIELPVWFNATHLWANRLREIRSIIEQDKTER